MGERTKYLLIGGGLASSQAAKLIRMKDADGSLTIVTREAHPPYDRPPLSKEFLRGEKSHAEITFDTAESLAASGVALRLGEAVESLALDEKTARLASGRTIRFDKALIATGGDPIRLDVPGINLEGVYFLRTVDDALAIAAAAGKGKRAVVIGGGFIGIEVAASLTRLGVEVTVVEALSHIWAKFLGEEMAGYVQGYCSERGIAFVTNDKAAELRGTTSVSSVLTRAGVELPCDLACVGVGITPNVELARRAGLEVSDGIVVDECMQTSHPDVYAAGDVVNFPDPVFGKRRRVEHWGHAEYTGQVAGLNMAGTEQRYDLLTYVWSDVFDLHIEFAGDESEHDRTLVRGKIGDPSFTVLYVKGNVLTAYFAVNVPSREFAKLQRLIRRKVDVSDKTAELQDPTVDLKSLS